MNIFTNDDYRKIQAWLKANAIKDSELTSVDNTIPEEDTLVLIQKINGILSNVKISIKNLLNSTLSKIIIDTIIANAVKVNNILTVTASNVKIDNEKGTTLQDIIDWAETIENTAKGWKIEYQVPSIDEPTVRAKYVLKDSKGVPKGDIIKVYKDSAVTNVYLGTTEDICNENTGEVTKKPIQNNNEALSIVYRLNTGKYSLVNVPIGIFIREAEFDKYRGLGITENGQVFIKLANDVESSNYLHFNDSGELSADGIGNRILQDLGTIINSVAGDGTMWGQYKKEEGTKDSPTNEASRWGQYKQAEADRNERLNNLENKIEEADNEIKEELVAETARAKAAEQENAQAIAEEKEKTSDITREIIEEQYESIDIYPNNDSENTIFHLDENGLDAKNIKSNGKDVLTEHQDISGLATKEELNDKKSEINVAKEEALQAIAENEQSAITNFNSQRVTPDMLSESTKQLIEASGGGTITNLADDEDITSVDDGSGSNVLKFADRTYNPSNFSGNGYKILRKNIVDGKNVLTQDMINEPDTIYEIRYDFDCNSKTLVFPENCFLYFNGGSLYNFQKSTISDANNHNVCNVGLTGEVLNDVLYPEWFGAKGDGVNDDRMAIQACINICKQGGVIKLMKKHYVSFIQTAPTTSCLYLKSGIHIQGNDTYLFGSGVAHTVFNGRYPREYLTTINTNVNAGDRFVYVEDTSNYRVEDVVLLVGEDGTSQDKAEPINWMFNRIISITDNKIELEETIPFNINIENCNTSGSISTATRNGSISKLSLHDITIEGLCDYSDRTGKFGNYISILNGYNIRVNKIKSFNQGTVCFQYCYNLDIDNIEGIYNRYDDNGIETTTLVLWECNNVHVGNVTHSYAGKAAIVAAIKLEGGSTNINVDNVIANYNVTNESYSTSNLVCITSEGCQINISNITIHKVGHPYRTFISYTTNTTANKASVTVTNVQLKAVFSTTQKLLNLTSFYNTRELMITGQINVSWHDDGKNTINYRCGRTEQLHMKLLYPADTSKGVVIQGEPNWGNIITRRVKLYSKKSIDVKGNLIIDGQYNSANFGVTSENSIITRNWFCIVNQETSSILSMSNTNNTGEDQIVDMYLTFNYRSDTPLQVRNIDKIPTNNFVLDEVMPIGVFSDKPTTPIVGSSYFCTDKQTIEGNTDGIVIYYKGNGVWVDALGRVVS